MCSHAVHVQMCLRWPTHFLCGSFLTAMLPLSNAISSCCNYMETCLGTNRNAPHCTIGHEITRFIELGLCKSQLCKIQSVDFGTGQNSASAKHATSVY